MNKYFLELGKQAAEISDANIRRSFANHYGYQPGKLNSHVESVAPVMPPNTLPLSGGIQSNGMSGMASATGKLPIPKPVMPKPVPQTFTVTNK